MNLNLIANPGPAKDIAEAHIEQRIQVPHVPLKFNSETDNVTTVAILETPFEFILNVSDDLSISKTIEEYNVSTKNILNATYIYSADDVINKTEQFIMDLFNKLNLDEENYKIKTGRLSLYEDVLNKKDVHINKTNLNNKIIKNAEDYNFEESWILYNIARERIIKL
jgi:hypothetical protein